jgi:hypothetical protein
MHDCKVFDMFAHTLCAESAVCFLRAERTLGLFVFLLPRGQILTKISWERSANLQDPMAESATKAQSA